MGGRGHWKGHSAKEKCLENPYLGQIWVLPWVATDSRLISRKPSAALVGTCVCRNMHIEEPRGTFRHRCHHLGIVSDTVDLDQIPPDHHHHHHVHHHHRVRSVVSCYRNPCSINGTTVSTQSKTLCVGESSQSAGRVSPWPAQSLSDSRRIMDQFGFHLLFHHHRRHHHHNCHRHHNWHRHLEILPWFLLIRIISL